MSRQRLFPRNTAEPVKSPATEGMTDNLSFPVLDDGQSVHECQARRILRTFTD